MDIDEIDNTKLDSSVHQKFLKSINTLNKVQHIQKPTRREAVISKKNEFNLGKYTTTKSSNISVGDIFHVLKSSNQHVSVAKVLRNARRSKKVLKKALPKQVEEKIQRTVGYEQTKKKLNKWDVIVTSNQAAATQVFPNDFETHEDVTTNQDTKKFKSELMQEMEALNEEMKSVENDGIIRKKIEENTIKNKLNSQMSKDEIIAHRKELAFLRLQYSQSCAKARKQNKIKSKSYHKFLKREKIAAKVKELALLDKTDPEGVMENLDYAEKRRALERANLRHRNTSVWAKALQVRAKNDKDVQKDLLEQLALSRQLTLKVKDQNSSDSEREENENSDEKDDSFDFDPLNPWIKYTEKPKKDEVLLGYRKFWTDRNKNVKDLDDYRNIKVEENGVVASTEWEEGPIDKEDKVQLKTKKNTKKSSEINIDSIFNDADVNLKKRNKETLERLNDIFNSNKNVKKVLEVKRKKDSNLKKLSFKKTKSKIEIDEELIETPRKKELIPTSNDLDVLKAISEPNQLMEIDPNKYTENIVKTQKYIDLHKNNDTNMKDTIAAAFEDDDLVADFIKEQESKSTEKEDVLELSTPGWGSWVSAKNINNKTPKRMILKFPVEQKKKECNEGNVYIKNDVECKELKQHLVSSLPFPFKSVQEYESSIRAPIGRSFVPETAFKLLTRPAVITKKGKIIKPIDEEILKSGINKRPNVP